MILFSFDLFMDHSGFFPFSFQSINQFILQFKKTCLKTNLQLFIIMERSQAKKINQKFNTIHMTHNNQHDFPLSLPFLPVINITINKTTKNHCPQHYIIIKGFNRLDIWSAVGQIETNKPRSILFLK